MDPGKNNIDIKTLLGILGGGAAGGLFGTDPTKDAMKYLDNISGTEKYFNPYIQAGNESLPLLQKLFGQMTGDPGALYAKLGAGYQESPGFKFSRDQALQAATRAANAGGMAGSPMHEQQSMQLANNLSSQDYNNYMQKILGLFGGGVGGYQDLSHQGLSAGQSLADMIAQMNAAKSKLAYEGGAQQNQNMGNLFGGLGGILANLFFK